MPSFAVPPPPLTPPQRRVFWIAAALVAATRLVAMASSPWDWDEVQFMAGVREYDVGRHHPHPAGFPLYILAGKLVRLAGMSDFRSLQVVAFLAACALFPIAFLLGRELRFEFRTSILAALLFVFLPNTWYFGGTIFSDITGTAIALAAVVMLLRGCRDGRAFLIGCALVGVALGVRPHSGFVLLPPLLVATWHRRREWGRIAAGAAITAAIAGGSYAGAALASESVAVYVHSVRHFQEWVRHVDTIANPGRTPLRTLAVDFFVRPMGAGRLSMIVAALSLAGLAFGIARRHRGAVLTFVSFAPFMIFAWLMLDPVGYRRYATAYVVVYALLTAYALERLTAPLRRAAAAAHVVVVALIVARYVWWALPAIIEVRTTIAPTHAASTYAQQVVPPGRRIWVDDSMTPWASYYLADRKVVRVESPAGLPATGAAAGEYFLTEGTMAESSGKVFGRTRGRVAEIHPERHFEASVAPLSSTWRFGEGWSDPEGHLELHWRWMAGKSEVLIPAAGGPGRLLLDVGPPAGIAPDVEVRLNGALLDRLHLDRRVRKEWVVQGIEGWNRLQIHSSATINPLRSGRGSDPRDLALRLFDYRWQTP